MWDAKTGAHLKKVRPNPQVTQMPMGPEMGCGPKNRQNGTLVGGHNQNLRFAPAA